MRCCPLLPLTSVCSFACLRCCALRHQWRCLRTQLVPPLCLPSAHHAFAHFMSHPDIAPTSHPHSALNCCTRPSLKDHLFPARELPSPNPPMAFVLLHYPIIPPSAYLALALYITLHACSPSSPLAAERRLFKLCKPSFLQTAQDVSRAVSISWILSNLKLSPLSR